MTILAYDVSDKKRMLDASRLAHYFALDQTGRYRHINQGYHWNEILAIGGLDADDYNLLAVFPTTNHDERSLSTPWGSIRLPSEYWLQHSLSLDPLEALRREVYVHTGVWDETRTDKLILALLRR